MMEDDLEHEVLRVWLLSLTIDQLFFLKKNYEEFLVAQSQETQGSGYIQ